jgi:hypothetical protein
MKKINFKLFEDDQVDINDENENNNSDNNDVSNNDDNKNDINDEDFKKLKKTSITWLTKLLTHIMKINLSKTNNNNKNNNIITFDNDYYVTSDELQNLVRKSTFNDFKNFRNTVDNSQDNNKFPIHQKNK